MACQAVNQSFGILSHYLGNSTWNCEYVQHRMYRQVMYRYQAFTPKSDSVLELLQKHERTHNPEGDEILEKEHLPHG
jgi:hypothetical protein